MSGYVALCLSLPGTVVTWFVTGFPDPGKVGRSHAVPLKPALSGKTSLRWRVIWRWLAIWQARYMPPISCDNSGLGWRTVKEAACPRR